MSRTLSKANPGFKKGIDLLSPPAADSLIIFLQTSSRLTGKGSSGMVRLFPYKTCFLGYTTFQ